MVLRRFLLFLLFTGVLAIAPFARAQMSDTERKASARAAYQEGIQLQDAGKHAEALARFEAAQKLFDAPTHQLRIAETQALTGKLVEASETYETLIRRQLPPGSPEAFVQAQQQAQAEVQPLRQRIPTVRVTVNPDAQTLQDLEVRANGVQMPNELLGIARPINPGTYKLTAKAAGYGTPVPVEIEVKEKEAKAVEIVLRPMATPTAVTPAPVPAPYTAGPESPDGRDGEPARAAPTGPTKTGLLIGPRVGALVPGGSLQHNASFEDVATAGPAFGVDAMVRLARMLLIGASFEVANLGIPDRLATVPANIPAEATNVTTYLGLTLGVLPNADKFSFIGDIGLGYRSLSTEATWTLGGVTTTRAETYGGGEFTLGVGMSIPAGPLRIVPKAQLAFGSFANRGGETITDTAGHSFFFVGVGLYYSASFGKRSMK
jgi:hypothetical protein